MYMLIPKVIIKKLLLLIIIQGQQFAWKRI